MATRKIVVLGDDVLRKPCKCVEDFDQNLHTLLDDLKETLKSVNGLGLAAPQVAVLKRACIIVNGKRGSENFIELVNPQIVKESTVTIAETEGCLSVKGDNGKSIYKSVERPKWVVVHFSDRFGERHEQKFKGYVARAVCHELDHLDGILFIDRVKE